MEIFLALEYIIAAFTGVRGDKPRALTNGLSPVKANNRGIIVLYFPHPCRHCAV